MISTVMWEKMDVPDIYDKVLKKEGSYQFEKQLIISVIKVFEKRKLMAQDQL